MEVEGNMIAQQTTFERSTCQFRLVANLLAEDIKEPLLVRSLRFYYRLLEAEVEIALIRRGIGCLSKW